jgi:hypothetical protein
LAASFSFHRAGLPRQVFAKVQHLDDGLNVPRQVAQFIVPLPVFKYLPAWLHLKPFKGVDGPRQCLGL